MKLITMLMLTALLPFQALAVDPPIAPVSASEVTLSDFLYLKRPLVVFADSPNNPNFVRQMALLTQDAASLVDRDVIVITDTDPAAQSDARQKLRPRGFSLVLMDKDGKVVMRKPSPWSTREITHAIDRSPLRRQEMLERSPAGR